MSCLKFTLFFINFCVLVFGVALLSLGIFIEVEKNEVQPYLAVAGISRLAFGIVLIADGIFVVAIGLIGCLGVGQEKRGCLIFQAAFLIIIFLVLVIASGVLYGYRHKLTSSIKKGMTASLRKYNTSAADTTGWNKVQEKLKCCGVHNSSDYFVPPLAGWQSVVYLPSSCCAKNASDPEALCLPNDAYTVGCYQGVLDHLTKNWYTWGGAAIGIAVGLLISVGVTLCYCRSMSRYQTV